MKHDDDYKMTAYAAEKDYRICHGTIRQIALGPLIPFTIVTSHDRKRRSHKRRSGSTELEMTEPVQTRKYRIRDLRYLIEEFGAEVEEDESQSKRVIEDLGVEKRKLTTGCVSAEKVFNRLHAYKDEVELLTNQVMGLRAELESNEGSVSSLSSDSPKRPMARRSKVKAGAVLSFQQACALLGKPEENLRSAIESGQVVQYESGFSPTEIIRYGEQLGGTYCMRRIYRVYNPYPDSLEDSGTESTQCLEMKVDGVWFSNKSAWRYDENIGITYLRIESEMLFGVELFNQIQRVSGLSLVEIEAKLDQKSEI